MYPAPAQTNAEEDFKEYEDNIVYIKDEKVFREEMETFEKGIYEDGIKDGTKKGKKEGLKEGEEIGIKKGSQEGEEAERTRIAAQLEAGGVPPDAIQKATGLSAEAIAAL